MPPATTPRADALTGFLERVLSDGSVDLTVRLDPAAIADPAEASAARHLNELLDRVQQGLSSITSAVNRASAAARTAQIVEDAIGEARSQADGSEAISHAVHESALGAAVVSQLAGQSKQIADGLATSSATSADTLDGALTSLQDLAAGSEQVSARVSALIASAQEIAGVVSVIADISQRANILSINAAIEAARAGVAGRTFKVVASEIRSLSDSTKRSNDEIGAMAAQIRALARDAAEVLEANTRRVADVSGAAASAMARVGDMTSLISASVEHVASIATVAEQQAAALTQVTGDVDRQRASAREMAERMEDIGASHGAVGELNQEVNAILLGFRIGRFADGVRDLAREMAARVEAALGDGRRDHGGRAHDVFDTAYREMRGGDVARLRTICDVSRASAGGFDPPKFFLSYDAAYDADFAAIVDAAMTTEPRLDFACVVDINGLLLMHARAYRRDITGDRDADFVGNRVKRFFERDVELRAARVGLGDDHAKAPPRTPRRDFARYGAPLRRREAAPPAILQSYPRDTGQVMNDVAAPVHVRGEVWGAVRLCYRADVE